MRVPRRTCLGCRRARSKSELVRLVRGETGIARVDPRGGAPGRGAYVCPEPTCIERGLVRPRLERALRGPCQVPRGLGEMVRAAARVGEARDAGGRAVVIQEAGATGGNADRAR